MYTMRFDMRAPSTGAPAAELYAAALDICAWSETRGAVAAVICEHHASPDGYLPSPLIMAGAVAARTEKLPIKVAIFTLPFYNPVKLAEDLCVLDILSGGRVSYISAMGYREEEYEMLGVDFHRRGAIADEKLALLLKAVTGEAFEHEGRRIHVTPPPLTPGGPHIAWGGGSVPAAKRAGRFGLDFSAERGDPGLREVYETACRENGHTPGKCNLPPASEPTVIFVADDLDAAWAELGPYLMNDVLPYAAWNVNKPGTTSISQAATAEELRAENRSHRIVTVEQAIERIRSGKPLQLHPLIGGLPPKIAWKYLETVAERVMPAVGR